MKTILIEATNIKHGGFNWGKFMLARPTEEEWATRSAVDHMGLLAGRGWGPEHLWVLDLQTGEGAYFKPSPYGIAKADLNKRKIWVCPLFEPFLCWLYLQNLSDLDALPALVNLDAPSDSAGYRRPGSED